MAADFANHVLFWLVDVMKVGDAEVGFDLDGLEEVEINPMAELGYDEIPEIFSKPNLCYNNAFHFVSNHPEAKYVVGYGHSVIPIDHAWVKVDGKYYDPSWEANSGLEGKAYVPLYELDMADLLEIIPDNNMCPPAAVDMMNYHAAKGDE